MGLREIRIANDTPCGDACCCWMPPAKYSRDVDRNSNLVIELTGRRSPYPDRYDFGTGKCPHLQFGMEAHEEEDGHVLTVVGRCTIWPEPTCQVYPRNRKNYYCDYEKCLWAPERQLKEMKWKTRLYYGFRKTGKGEYAALDECCKDDLVKEVLLSVRKDRFEPRVQEIKVGTASKQRWLLVRVPIREKVCDHLPQLLTLEQFPEMYYQTNAEGTKSYLFIAKPEFHLSAMYLQLRKWQDEVQIIVAVGGVEDTERNRERLDSAQLLNATEVEGMWMREFDTGPARHPDLKFKMYCVGGDQNRVAPIPFKEVRS